MPRTPTAAALLLLAACAPSLGAATLDDCFRQALRQSETLAEDHEAILQAREQYHQAIAAVLPNLSLNYSYTRQDDHAYTPILREFNPAQQNVATVTLTQPLFQGFAEYAALREVKDAVVESKDAHRWAAMQIYQEVAQEFFTVLSLQASRELLREQVADDDRELAEERVFQSIGRARDSDVETVESNRSLLLAAGSQVDEQVAVEREVLAFMTGASPDEDLEDSSTPPASAGSLPDLAKGLDRRPDVHAALDQDRVAAELVRIAHGSHWPVVDLIAHYYPNSVLNQSYSIQRGGISSTINWDATVSATLPLFEGGALLSKDRQAASVKRQADLNLELTRRQALSNLRTAHATLAGDLDQIRAYSQAYRDAAKAYRSIDGDYRNGLDTIQDVMLDLNAAWAAKQELETAEFTARDDYEQLQVLAGNRLDLYPDPDRKD